MSSDTQMNSATIKEAKELAKEYYLADIPVYLWGPPGVGKSDAMRQMARELSIGFVDVRLGSKLPEDLHGIPVPDLERQLAIWLKASFWPDVKRHGPKGIILFDEMSDTSKAVQSVTYQVILDRCIGEVKLPDGWWPAAAGNRREDHAAAQAVSTALANRFAHVDVVPDADTWREYANVRKLHHFVVGFLKMRPNLLHAMEGSDLRAFPTPRAWEQVCKLVDRPPGIRMKLVRGLVGSGAAAEFESYMKGINIPDFEEIVADPKGCRVPKEPACRYALSAMLAQHTTRQNFGKVNEYIKREAFGRDFEIVTVLDATKRDASLLETKAYTDFAARNSDVTL